MNIDDQDLVSRVINMYRKLNEKGEEVEAKNLIFNFQKHFPNKELTKILEKLESKFGGIYGR